MWDLLAYSRAVAECNQLNTPHLTLVMWMMMRGQCLGRLSRLLRTYKPSPIRASKTLKESQFGGKPFLHYKQVTAWRKNLEWFRRNYDKCRCFIQDMRGHSLVWWEWKWSESFEQYGSVERAPETGGCAGFSFKLTPIWTVTVLTV